MNWRCQWPDCDRSAARVFGMSIAEHCARLYLCRPHAAAWCAMSFGERARVEQDRQPSRRFAGPRPEARR